MQLWSETERGSPWVQVNVIRIVIKKRWFEIIYSANDWIYASHHHQMLSRDGTVTIILRNNKSCAITMETRPLCPLPLCHHRCQSWKNLGSLCALWYSWLCNQKGHRYPTDPFRETGITTETKTHKWREWEIERFLNQASLHRPVSHLLGESSGFEATMMEKIRNPKHQ